MSRFLHYFLSAVTAAIVALTISAYKAQHIETSAALSAGAATDQPAFTHMIKTNKLRCGYIVLPPEFSKDPNTGIFSGVGFDIAEAMAKSLNLTVDWVEEVNFVNLTEGLKAGRYDAVCFPLYLGNIAQARTADFTTPFYYTGSGIFVRSDDNRFDNNISLINAPTITVATLDGEMSQTIRAVEFPYSKDFSLPQTSDVSTLLQSVETGKADVTFADQLVATPYLNANPGKLRDLRVGNPLRFHGHGFAVAKGETKLANTLSMALQELQYSGEMDKILQKDGMNISSVLLPINPYSARK